MICFQGVAPHFRYETIFLAGMIQVKVPTMPAGEAGWGLSEGGVTECFDLIF